MSYILDALRKSDQQRQRGLAPTLLTAQAATTGTRSPSLLAYGAVAVVLVAIGVAVGWLRPWQDQQAAPVPTGVAKPAAPASRPEAETAQSANVAPSAPSAQTTVPGKSQPRAGDATPKSSGQPGTPSSAQTAKAIPPQPAMNPSNASPAKLPAAPQRSAGISDTHSPAQDVKADAAPEQQPPWMAELPVDVQRDLPAMQVMVHAYSARPGERMVGINNKLWHEGDEVAPGLKLEQITPEGMILNFKGHVFRRGVH
jgi:general secretion pathway protein B